MRNKIIFSSPFFLSISLGVVCWLLVFIIFPIEVVFPISFKVVVFILLSYICMITGYLNCTQKELLKASKSVDNWVDNDKNPDFSCLIKFLNQIC